MKKHRGFTLIELVVVVLVVAILAAIALPSFVKQVRKSRRSEVESAIQQAALLEERYRAECTTYADFGTTCAASGVSIPAWSTLYSKTTYYGAPTVSNITATSYTIPVSATSGSTQAKDKSSSADCTTLYYVYGADTTSAVVTACGSLTPTAGQVSKCPVACWGN